MIILMSYLKTINRNTTRGKRNLRIVEYGSLIYLSLRRDQFDLDAVRIFEEDAVISTGKRVLVQIEYGYSPLHEFGGQFVNMLS